MSFGNISVIDNNIKLLKQRVDVKLNRLFQLQNLQGKMLLEENEEQEQQQQRPSYGQQGPTSSLKMLMDQQKKNLAKATSDLLQSIFEDHQTLLTLSREASSSFLNPDSLLLLERNYMNSLDRFYHLPGGLNDDLQLQARINNYGSDHEGGLAANHNDETVLQQRLRQLLSPTTAIDSVSVNLAMNNSHALNSIVGVPLQSAAAEARISSLRNRENNQLLSNNSIRRRGQQKRGFPQSPNPIGLSHHEAPYPAAVTNAISATTATKSSAAASNSPTMMNLSSSLESSSYSSHQSFSNSSIVGKASSLALSQGDDWLEQSKNKKQKTMKQSRIHGTKARLTDTTTTANSYFPAMNDTINQPSSLESLSQRGYSLSNFSSVAGEVSLASALLQEDESPEQGQKKQRTSFHPSTMDLNIHTNQILRKKKKKMVKVDRNDVKKNRIIVTLGSKRDSTRLSEFLTFLRSDCIEVFVATADDVQERQSSKKVNLGQVGIRCRFCAHLSSRSRVGRSSNFPSSISGIYQGVSMMIYKHFALCDEMPLECRKKYDLLKKLTKRGDTESRSYWVESAIAKGMVDLTDSREGRCIKFVGGGLGI